MASEYGWQKERILYETYPEEFFLLARQIKMRRVDEYLMQAAITSNPFKEAEVAAEFIDRLMSQRRYMRGEPEVPAELDVATFNAFKQQVQKESRAVGAK